MSLIFEPRHNFNEPITLGKKKVLPGESADAVINVGKLPSGTKIHLEAKIFRSKNPGPTALVIGGVHGDEINGIQIVRKSIADGIYQDLKRGSVIAISLLNVFGFINFSREVPDGKDVNRSFPGYKYGSLASRVAYTLRKLVLLPYIDFVMDFHTGGSFRHNFPQIRFDPRDERARELATYFSPRFIIEKSFISKSLRKICYQNNIPNIVFEGGESVRLDGYAIEVGVNGLRNVFNTLGMNEGNTIKPSHKPILCTATSWIRAPHSGIFIWSKRSGNFVEQGEPLGTIGDPYDNSSVNVIANKTGYLIGHNNASVVNRGDALFHISYKYEDL